MSKLALLVFVCTYLSFTCVITRVSLYIFSNVLLECFFPYNAIGSKNYLGTAGVMYDKKKTNNFDFVRPAIFCSILLFQSFCRALNDDTNYAIASRSRSILISTLDITAETSSTSCANNKFSFKSRSAAHSRFKEN